MSIRDNVDRIRERVVAACDRAGRSPGDVQLMAVSKTRSAAMVHEAYEAGVTVFGENRVQEFATKHDAVRDLRIEWHLIGHLQSNKAAKAVALFDCIDSVDSYKLMRRIDQAAQDADHTLDVMLEINIGEEAGKTGFLPEHSELGEVLRDATLLPRLRIRGLMCIPPLGERAEDARRYFKQMRELRDRLAARHRLDLDELSMGMSDDFEVAIEEGSTCIRLGTAIFGERQA